MESEPKYKTLVQDPEGRFNLQVSEKGTEFNSKIPCFKTEYYFDSKFLVFEVGNCLHDQLQRAKWDQNIQQSIVDKEKNRLQVLYIRNKAATIGIQARDFYEKKLRFFS